MTTLGPKFKGNNRREKQKEGSEGESENTIQLAKRQETLLYHAEIFFRRVLFFTGFVFLLIKTDIMCLVWRDTV